MLRSGLHLGFGEVYVANKRWPIESNTRRVMVETWNGEGKAGFLPQSIEWCASTCRTDSNVFTQVGLRKRAIR